MGRVFGVSAIGGQIPASKQKLTNGELSKPQAGTLRQGQSFGTRIEFRRGEDSYHDLTKLVDLVPRVTVTKSDIRLHQAIFGYSGRA